MKLFIIFAGILSAAVAKSVESDTEQFECMANYLRDKNLLDSSFKYYVQSEPLDCEPYLVELRKELLHQTRTPRDSSSEEDEKAVAFKKIIAENFECAEEQLNAIKYPEQIMKIALYKLSTQMTKTQKKKLLAEAHKISVIQVTLATIVCHPEPFFGKMFDDLMADRTKHATIEGKQNSYCARKYALDNSLIDTTKYTVNLNPDNIELNFDCQKTMAELLKMFEEMLKTSFPMNSKKETDCMNRTIREDKFTDFMVKVTMLSEVSMTVDDKKALRNEFIPKFQKLYLNMIKCVD